MKPRTLAALAGALTAALATPTSAAPPVAIDRATTDGVDRPIHDYSADGDASSLELNPALLSGPRGIDLVVMGYHSLSAFTRGSGFGVFTGLNFGFGLALGVGVQGVYPGIRQVADFDADRNPNMTKLSIGLSGGDSRFAATGLAFHIPFATTLPRTPDLDVGLMFRLRNWASLGGVLRYSPTRVTSNDVILNNELSVAAELSFRPIYGERWLELAGGVKSRWQSVPAAGTEGERIGWLGVFPRGRMAIRFQGLEIAGEVEQVRVAELDEQTYQFGRYTTGIRGSVALGLSWDYISVRGGIHAGLTPGGIDGYSVAARFTSAPAGRVYWPRIVGAERIDLSEVRDERDQIALLTRLERAREAGKRTILVVDARNTKASWASLHELREAIIQVRNAGGHVYGYVESAGLKDYYIASVAEEVFIHPAGELSIFGLSATSLYFKGALDKLGVKVEALHIDEYKSAHEPFTRQGPSAKDREQREELLKDTFEVVAGDIARARGVSVARVRELVNGAPHGPDEAVALGLADEVVYRDQLIDEVSDRIGARVSFHEYPDTDPEPRTWSTSPYVAVVLVEGTIIDGKSRHIPILNIHFTGGDTIAETLRELRSDWACKGIILRVNSPGGSALASDIIWREVDKTREAHQKSPKRSPPIVISMSDVAASGGYYISAGARDVYAQPTTITGSIGVVSMNFDLSGLLSKLGISTTTFKQGEHADINSLFRSMTPTEVERLTKSMRRTYDLFVKRVSEARGLTPEKVDELGRGHVYSGTDALALGLVDGLGGLPEAIARVRTMSRVPKPVDLEIRVLPRRRTLLDLILTGIGSPFGRRGAADKVYAKQAEKQRLPLALDAAVARLPLSILFLPSARVSALMPAVIEIE